MFATAVQISIITLQMYTLTVQKYTIAFAIVAKFNALVIVQQHTIVV